MKRVFPKFEAERSHPRGVNGRSKFRKKIEIRGNVRRFKVDKVPSWNKGRPSICIIAVDSLHPLAPLDPLDPFDPFDPLEPMDPMDALDPLEPEDPAFQSNFATR